MSRLLEDVATRITVNIGTLTLGTNLFLGRMPDDPDLCVALYQYGGEQAVATMGGDAMPPIEQPRFQVVVRAAGYTTAHDLASTIWGVLDSVLNESLSSTLYYKITGIQSPFPMDRDTQDRIVFAQNFKVQRVL
jgi:hypothetical protein